MAKLADPRGSRPAMRDFGVPAAAAGAVGLALPIVEIAVGLALLPEASAWLAAVGALVLLLGFVAGIAVNLARGREPDCHCFGQLHSKPAGPSTLVRNGGLAVVAAFVVLAGGDDAGAGVLGWVGHLEPTEVAVLVAGLALTATLAAGGNLMLSLLRQHGRMLLRLDALEAALAAAGISVAAADGGTAAGLPVGEEAPDFVLPDLDGQRVSLDSLRGRGRPVLVVFTDPGCGPCRMLSPTLGLWQREPDPPATVAVLSGGARDDIRAMGEEHALRQVLVQGDEDVSAAYEAHGTPAAVAVDTRGLVASSLAFGPEAIEALYGRIVGGELPDIVQVQGNGNPVHG